MKSFVIVSCCFLALTAGAQSVFFRDLPELANPAATAFEHSFSSNLLYNSRGLFDADLSSNSLNGSISKKMNSINSGLGITFGTGSASLTDYYLNSFTSFGVNYNYQWKLDADSKVFSLGVRPLFSSSRLADFYTDENGEILNSEYVRRFDFSMAYGAAFKTKQLSLGATLYNLPTFSNESSGYSFDLIAANLIASYEFYLSNIRILPAATVLINQFQTNSQINVRIIHDHFWWQPGVYLSNSSISSGIRSRTSGAIGYQFNEKINIGVSAEFDPNAAVFPGVWFFGTLFSFELD
jgi:hypothetical protein